MNHESDIRINPENRIAIADKKIPIGRRQVQRPLRKALFAAAFTIGTFLNPNIVSASAPEYQAPPKASEEILKNYTAEDIHFWKPADIADLLINRVTRPPLPEKDEKALNKYCRPLNGTGKPCMTTPDLEIYYYYDSDSFGIREKTYPPPDEKTEKEEVFKALSDMGFSHATIANYPMMIQPSGR